jgi:hypothetical protein
MDEAKTRENHCALLFTDSLGRVVFVDNNFLNMMHCAEEGIAVGEPLEDVLGLDRHTVAQLMRKVAQDGYVLHRLLELRDVTGSSTRVWCTGVATYQNGGTFIGADFILQDSAWTGIPEAQLEHHHADILGRLLKYIRTRARSLEDQTLLQSYFTAQVNALQVLLAHMGGLRTCATLEAIVNESAQRNGWPVCMKDGNLEVEPMDVEAEAKALCELLSQVVDYVVGVVGRRLVVQEMQAVDEQADEWALEAASRSGMRELIGALQ